MALGRAPALPALLLLLGCAAALGARVTPDARGGALVEAPHAEDALAEAEGSAHIDATGIEQLPEFRRASVVVVDRDVAQYPARLAVLRAGKVLVVPQPGRRGAVLGLVDPTRIDAESYAEAATTEGLRRFAEPLGEGARLKADLVVFGSMAVNPETGTRCSKAGAATNLDYSTMRQMGVVELTTPIATVAREIQLLDDESADRVVCRDVPVDIVCTPKRTIRVEKSLPKPMRAYWDKLSPKAEPVAPRRNTRRQSGKGGRGGGAAAAAAASGATRTSGEEEAEVAMEAKSDDSKATGAEVVIAEAASAEAARAEEVADVGAAVGAEAAEVAGVEAAQARGAWAMRNRIRALAAAANTSVDDGAENATASFERLREFWRARVVRVGLDRHMAGIRLAALRSGKALLVPRPGLRGLSFLDPRKINASQYAEAVTAAGVEQFGDPVDFHAMLRVDLFVVGSLAVHPVTGCRLGHFGSVEELEYRILRQLRIIDEATPVVTAVHDLELVEDLPSDEVSCSDVPADIVCTPTRVIRMEGSASKPSGIDVGKLLPQELGHIEILHNLRAKLQENLGHELPAVPEKVLMKWAAQEKLLQEKATQAEQIEEPAREPTESVWALRSHIRDTMAADNATAPAEALEAAARQVEQLPEFRSAGWVRVHTHWRELAVRLAVLRAGKMLVVPQPGLRGLVLLNASRIDPSDYAAAVTEAGIEKFGEVIDMKKPLKLDLFVIGSVLANPATGCRIGPFGGLEDFEYGLLRETGALGEATPVATVLFDLELVGGIPAEHIECHDVPVDIICTPTRAIRLRGALPKPAVVNWERLPHRDLGSIELLQRWRAAPDAPATHEAAAPRSGKGGRSGAAQRVGKGGESAKPPARDDAESRVASVAVATQALAQTLEASGALQRFRASWEAGASEIEAAGMRFEASPELRRATTVRAPMHPSGFRARLAALRAGKLLLVRRKGLRMMLVNGSSVPAQQKVFAATEDGIALFAKPIKHLKLKVDIFVIASVVVNPGTGCRVGEPAILEELEYKALREARAVDSETLVVSTVHEAGVIDSVPRLLRSEVSVDLIFTPTGAITVENPAPKPLGIAFAKVPKPLVESVPALRKMQGGMGLSPSEIEVAHDLDLDRRTLRQRLRRRRRNEPSSAAAKSLAFEVSAMHVEQLPEFQRAACVRTGMDEATFRIRLAVLWTGKKLLVPNPRSHDLVVLDAMKIYPDQVYFAVTAEGVEALGEPVTIDAGLRVDLFVISSTALNPANGCRVGSEENSDDFDYRLLRELRALDDATPVVTPVDEAAIMDDIPSKGVPCHEVPVDIVCTPRRTLRVEAALPRPRGVHWSEVPAWLADTALARGVRAWADAKARRAHAMNAPLGLRSGEAKNRTPGGNGTRLLSAVRHLVDARLLEEKALSGPSFDLACHHAASLPEFKRARVVRVNQSWRNFQLRLAAVAAGKILIMPFRGLRDLAVIDPAAISPDHYAEAVTTEGARKFGKMLDIENTKLKVDLFVIGSVAVDPATGDRYGPFGTYEDLEYMLLRELGVVDAGTPVLAAAVEAMLVGDLIAQTDGQRDEVPAEIICLPDRTIRLQDRAKPSGVDWGALTERKLSNDVVRRVQVKVGAVVPLPTAQSSSLPEPTELSAPTPQGDAPLSDAAGGARGRAAAAEEAPSPEPSPEAKEVASDGVVARPPRAAAKMAKVAKGAVKPKAQGQGDAGSAAPRAGGADVPPPSPAPSLPDASPVESPGDVADGLVSRTRRASAKPAKGPAETPNARKPKARGRGDGRAAAAQDAPPSPADAPPSDVVDAAVSSARRAAAASPKAMLAKAGAAEAPDAPRPRPRGRAHRGPRAARQEAVATDAGQRKRTRSHA